MLPFHGAFAALVSRSLYLIRLELFLGNENSNAEKKNLCIFMEIMPVSFSSNETQYPR